MEKITKLLINRTMLVNVLILALVIVGGYTILNINRDAFPEITLGTVTITTIYPGASASDVELNVTIPIENAIEEVSGIEEIVSTSSEGISQITVTVDSDADDAYFNDIYIDIEQAVSQVNNLPDGVDGLPLVEKIASYDAPFIEIAFSGPIDTLQQFIPKVEKDLMKMNEISQTTLVGVSDPEINILVDPVKAKENMIGLRQIANAIESRNMEGTGGTLKTFKGERKVVALNKFEDYKEVLDTPIRTSLDYTDYAVQLKDIASLDISPEDRKLIVRTNGKSGASIVLTKKRTADVLKTSDKISEYINELNMPPGVEAFLLYDNSRLTRDRLSLTVNNALLGFLLVFIILFVVLDFNTAIWTAFGIPFSLLFALIILHSMGHTLNILTLGGFIVVIGMLVDDAIVIAEQYKSLLEEGKERKEAAVEAVRLMWLPVLASSVTTILAFGSAIFIRGLPGKFIWIMPLLIMICLGASLIDAYFFLPVHISHGKTKTKKTSGIKKIENVFSGIITNAVKFRYVLLPLFFVLILFSAYIGRNFIKLDAFPQDASDGIILSIEFPRNFDAEKTIEYVSKIETILTDYDGEYLGMSSRIGTDSTSIITDRGTQENLAVVYVYLTPYSTRKRNAYEIIESLTEDFKDINDIGFTYTMDVKRVGLGLGWPFEFRVVANDNVIRDQKVNEIVQYLNSLEAIEKIDTDVIEGIDELNVTMNYDMISRAQLTVKDVLTTLRIAFDGMVVSSFREGDIEMDYRIRLTEKARADREFINTLPIANSNGMILNLDQFVSMKEKRAAGQITRYNGVRATTVFGTLDKKKLSGNALYDQVREKFPDSDNYSIIFDGEVAESDKIFSDAGIAFLAAILLIFLVLALVFNSFKQPFIILVSMPFVAPGIILSVFLHGYPLSIFTALAVIGLVGIVINDSIVLVDGINKLRAEDSSVSIKDAVIKTAISRLRPILLSSFTTILGLIPTGYAIGGYDPFLSQMCIAMLYGLLYGTMVSLIIVPLFYIVGNDIQNFFGFLRGGTSSQKKQMATS
jgi:multidrug efflux pump subunit AcrB